MSTKKTNISKLMAVARESNPDLWERTDAVARIIDPGAFADNWVIHPSDAAKVMASRLKYKQAVAMHKAQEVLHFLGVNTDVDWLEILTLIAKDDE